MSVRARSYVFVTIALLVASLALLGCPKRPEVTQASGSAIGPSAGALPPGGSQAGTQGGDIKVSPTPPPQAEVTPAPGGTMPGGSQAAPGGTTGGGQQATPYPLPTTPGTGTQGSAAVKPPESPVKDVFFDFDQANIKDDQKAALNEDVAWLKQNAGAKVTLEGHCDERGSSEYNLALGERRAKAVKDYLVAAGIPADRIATVSYGEERPFVLGHDESAWKWNRRGHFVVSGK